MTPKDDPMGKTPLSLATLNALTICQALDSAAEAMTLHDGSQWAAWMCYLLQALEYKAADPTAYQAFLESVDRDLAVRLERGRW
jgi:hypothetical protein